MSFEKTQDSNLINNCATQMFNWWKKVVDGGDYRKSKKEYATFATKLARLVVSVYVARQEQLGLQSMNSEWNEVFTTIVKFSGKERSDALYHDNECERNGVDVELVLDEEIKKFIKTCERGELESSTTYEAFVQVFEAVKNMPGIDGDIKSKALDALRGCLTQISMCVIQAFESKVDDVYEIAPLLRSVCYCKSVLSRDDGSEYSKKDKEVLQRADNILKIMVKEWVKNCGNKGNKINFETTSAILIYHNKNLRFFAFDRKEISKLVNVLRTKKIRFPHSDQPEGVIRAFREMYWLFMGLVASKMLVSTTVKSDEGEKSNDETMTDDTDEVVPQGIEMSAADNL